MNRRFARNQQFLTDLFAGPFRGHGLIFSPPGIGAEHGDFTLSERPVRDWLPWLEQTYAQRVAWSEALDDDAVPYLGLNTNTGIFAAAFGCRLHRFEGSPAAARPAVFSAAEADRLTVPDLAAAPTLRRILELADLAAAHFGPEVPIGVPDVQSPFDIAALVWDKAGMFTALLDEPAAVCRLVDKCHALLAAFLAEFVRRYPQANLCHCPYAWAPPSLGCWLSEDEAGALSIPMFAEFCLPSLTRLSQQFGGLFMHCCADADHQYGNFRRIPRLRGLNRVFQASGPGPAIAAFSPETVLMNAWYDVEFNGRCLDLARPGTRFLFNLSGAATLDEARRQADQLRARCPRRN